MKKTITSVSLPVSTFAKSRQLAKKFHWTFSTTVEIALEEFVKRHQHSQIPSCSDQTSECLQGEKV